MHIAVFLLPIIIVFTWARLVRPGANLLQGSVLLAVSLPLLARLRMHLIPAVLALGIGLYLVIRQDLPLWTLMIPVVSDLLLIAIPVKYTITDQGIRLGLGSFRRWTEFAGVRRAPGGARLQGMHRQSGFHIWLSGSRGDDEFLQFLRQTIKRAYKGNSSVIPFPVDRVHPSTEGDQIATGS
ncbi:MAG TPA: hypothetical protein VEW66_02670 [Thermomicrobiales bacterium]|nr:hypothetical protein [Thermomicrobiales bacterium]